VDAERIIIENNIKIKKLKQDLPSSSLVYSIKICLFLFLMVLVTALGLLVFGRFDGGIREFAAGLVFGLYYFISKNIPLLKKHKSLNREIRVLTRDNEALRFKHFEPNE
tara:strand:+ start:99 stop:425 length:327 start_codon:yes stop_codon:yes gene_type:complete